MPHTNNLLESVFASTLDPIVAVDAQLVIIMVNSAAESRLGAREGQSSLDLLAPLMDASDAVQQLRSNLEGNVPFEFDVYAKSDVYRCQAAPLQGKEAGWVLVLHNTTEFKKHGETKSRMLHMLAHDLKNPLAAIVGMTQMLIRKFDGYSDRQNAYLQGIVSSAARMETLIEGVIDLERVAAERIRKQSVDAHWLFRRLVGEFEQQASAKKHTLGLNMPANRVALLADEMQVYKAFSKLLNNAIKFTPDQGQIAIDVTCDSSNALVRISDNGYGIPASYQPRLFEPFFRARNDKTVDIPGNGVGLSFVKAVIELHDGRIWFESIEDKGSTFFVELPIVDSVDQEKLKRPGM